MRFQLNVDVVVAAAVDDHDHGDDVAVAAEDHFHFVDHPAAAVVVAHGDHDDPDPWVID